ncbi:MAG TPA: hypothetical protein VM163_10160, partial [bacterium]|nr:hypothetical protein [bacterium]
KEIADNYNLYSDALFFLSIEYALLSPLGGPGVFGMSIYFGTASYVFSKMAWRLRVDNSWDLW